MFMLSTFRKIYFIVLCKNRKIFLAVLCKNRKIFVVAKEFSLVPLYRICNPILFIIRIFNSSQTTIHFTGIIV